MTTPLVSIIIPCYNAEKYVGDAIRSALDQTYPNVEVIVIDDGSTDGSLEVIRSFGDAICWETGPNRGGCIARNRGVELASGELIQFLDADDLLHSNKLARQVPLMVDKVADLVFCDREGYPINNPDRVRTYPISYCGNDVVVLCLTNFLTTLAPLHWKRVLLSVGGFREDLPSGQDYELQIRLAYAGVTFYHLPEVLCTTRSVPNSVSSDMPNVLEPLQQLLCAFYEQLKEAGQLTDERARALSFCMARNARIYLAYRWESKAIEYFGVARKMHSSGGIREVYGRLGPVLYPMVGPIWMHRIVTFIPRLWGWLRCHCKPLGWMYDRARGRTKTKKIRRRNIH